MPRGVDANRLGPALLCFDGSEGAVDAIAQAGKALRVDGAIVLTVWEPCALWEPYDPATVLSAPLSKLASRALGLDEIARELAEERTAEEVSRAITAGFTAEGRTEQGRAWRTICDVAEEIDVATIVLRPRAVARGIDAPRERIVRGRGARPASGSDRPAARPVN
jgi:nucleotide-binding universal stress UspA family protein